MRGGPGRFNRYLWRSRDFGLYFSGVFMATLANQIQSVAVAWQIYAITRSPLALGYVGLAQFLPVAALFFVAGDVADRYNRRRILAISYAVQAVAAALLLVLTLLAAKSQWPFYAALVLLGSAGAFGQPAGQSFLPQLVTVERFPQAALQCAQNGKTSAFRAIFRPSPDCMLNPQTVWRSGVDSNPRFLAPGGANCTETATLTHISGQKT
jgi:MFS family permease